LRRVIPFRGALSPRASKRERTAVWRDLSTVGVSSCHRPQRPISLIRARASLAQGSSGSERRRFWQGHGPQLVAARSSAAASVSRSVVVPAAAGGDAPARPGTARVAALDRHPPRDGRISGVALRGLARPTWPTRRLRGSEWRRPRWDRLREDRSVLQHLLSTRGTSTRTASVRGTSRGNPSPHAGGVCSGRPKR
jgi:hypothetical protein